MPKKRHAKGSGSDERERLLRLLRLTASDRDGEALAALRRAALLMERLELDWEGLLRGAPPAADVLARAVAVGRASGLREGRAEAVRLAERAAERAYAEGVAAGRALAHAELVRAGAQDRAAAWDDEPALADVVEFHRRGAVHGGREACDEDRALIAAVLDNPHAPLQTVAFVADLRRWLDLRGPLTVAQRDALHRTHRRWGLGAA